MLLVTVLSALRLIQLDTRDAALVVKLPWLHVHSNLSHLLPTLPLMLLLPLCGGRRALTLAGLGCQVIRVSPLMAWRLVLGVGGSGTVFL